MFIYIHILYYYKLFLYFNLCLSKMLDSLLCSFTSISFITTSCSFNVCLSVTLNSVSCSFTSISFITNMNTGCIDLFWYVYDFYWSFVNSYVNTVYIKTDFHFSVVILSNRNIQSGCHVYRVEPKLQLLQRSMYKHYGGLRTNQDFLPDDPKLFNTLFIYRLYLINGEMNYCNISCSFLWNLSCHFRYVNFL